jgi:hypothetical protein
VCLNRLKGLCSPVRDILVFFSGVLTLADRLLLFGDCLEREGALWVGGLEMTAEGGTVEDVFAGLTPLTIPIGAAVANRGASATDEIEGIRVVIDASCTAMRECPPSRVTRWRQCTCRYPIPKGATCFAARIGLPSGLGQHETPRAVGENNRASPVRSATTCGNRSFTAEIQAMRIHTLDASELSGDSPAAT